MRQGIGIAALLAILILAAFGIKSCQVSQRNSALKDHTNSVSSLIQSSAALSTDFFSVLQTGSSTSGGGVPTIQQRLYEDHARAQNQLNQALGLSVPDEVKKAQQNLVLAMQMRADGIGQVANEIQRALSGDKQSINDIAAQMARLYASDVIYKDYTAPMIASALHAAGIAVGPPDGEEIAQQQFVPDIHWVNPTFVASKLHVGYRTATGVIAPGLHGHALNSVTVAGTTLQTGSTNTIPAKPPAMFTLNFTNTGQNTETGVVCKVTVSGTGVSGQTTVSQTTAGQSTSCQVPLSSAPPAGSAQVTATVAPVPGEKNTANNTLTFPVTFQ
jgi:hypothetical protein